MEISTTNAACRIADTPPWSCEIFDTLDSTNRLARNRPVWHAVRAEIQTGGYGRTGRHWVSDRGGLWLSAVLPAPGPAARWAILPLAAGWAVAGALARIGVNNLRVRWPNDILVGPRKLAGLLLERFSTDTAVVGLGLNVHNRPETADFSLAGQTTSLAALLPTAPSVDDVAQLMLAALRDMHATLVREGFAPIAADLTAQYLRPCDVSLTMNDHSTIIARFHGIDAEGRLLVTTSDGVNHAFAAHDVSLLREIS